MSKVGVKIGQFDAPVCNSFKATVRNEQLCYEVDLNRFRDEHNIGRQLKLGFAFLLDNNEDRQVNLVENNNFTNGRKFGLVNSVKDSDQDLNANVYIDTIGENDYYVVQ